MRCVAPRAAFYAMPYVSLPPGDRRRLRAGPAARHGHPVRLRIGIRHAARAGSFRIVFLGDPAELTIHLRRHRHLHPGLSGTRWLTPCLALALRCGTPWLVRRTNAPSRTGPRRLPAPDNCGDVAADARPQSGCAVGSRRPVARHVDSGVGLRTSPSSTRRRRLSNCRVL